jgi:chromosomal replication initiation ATPase DnaA
MVLFFSHVPLVRLDSAEDLQAFLTGIKGKMMNEQGEVSVSDLTDTMSEEDFVKLICEIMEVDPARLKADKKYRGGNYPIARQLHIIVRNKAFKMKTAQAAECYLKDHTTTIYATRIISGRREFDPAFRRLTDPIFTEIDAIISGSRRTM